MRKISEIAAWSVAVALIAYALWSGLTALNWDVIIKWLPRLSEGALLTLELVAIAVLAGLILARRGTGMCAPCPMATFSSSVAHHC